MDLTVLICTYNRRADVVALLDTVQNQQTGGRFEYEVIVVDNNSSDGTGQALAGRAGIRLLSESRQGKSYALETGIAAASGEVLFVVDSDQLLPPGYLLRAWEGIQSHPAVAIYGGKVLPLWPEDPPAWLTPEHWSPLAMLDMGDEPFEFTATRPICLLVPLYRMAPLRAANGFKLGMSVSKGQIGGVEDADLSLRLLRAGYSGYYDPALLIQHKVEPDRLTRAYHRRWHAGHGYFRARLREPGFEQARFHPFGIPTHLLRATAAAAAAWAGNRLLGRGETAFLWETLLCFYWGFMRQRFREQRAPSQPEAYA